MSDRTKKFLILGGFFISLEIVLIFTGFAVPFAEEIRNWSSDLFVIMFFLFVFNRGMGIITRMEKRFPRLSIYFLHVGWLMYISLLSGFGLSFVLAKLDNEVSYSDEAPDFDRVSEGIEIYYYFFYGAFILSSLLAV